jgi:ABC-2 type transport system permease protein
MPGPFHLAAHLNPFFYLIDGLRLGITGHADGSIVIGAIAVSAVNLALWLLAHALIARGYRLKA